MLCDLCGKNQATVHLTEIVDGAISELHLCEGCAHKKSTEMEQQFGLADLLAGLAQFTEKPDEEKLGAQLKCPKCGFSYQDFKKIGRLGCPQCYIIFKRYLNPLLKRIHGSTQHRGKVPLKVSGRGKKKAGLLELRLRLQKAIEEEAFEEAAQLRDQIKRLEKNENK
ncbi:MAG: UvrB/UvrC motif-containing protein [Candidatus Omnitrophica bacterium]|nr:UvrB/UvrC motif-containing protein [Candidatus Omnitrophota bacterium]